MAQAGTQITMQVKDEANRCLRTLPPFAPIEDYVPRHVLSALHQGATTAGKGFFAKRDVDNFPFVYCFYLMKGHLIATSTRQLLRLLSTNDSLASCKRLLVNLLASTKSWAASEACILELLGQVLSSKDAHLPVWLVTCMVAQSEQVSSLVPLLPLIARAGQNALAASRGNQQITSAAVAYFQAPLHKLVLQAYMDPSGLQSLSQWIGSVQSSVDPTTLASQYSSLDLTELHILASTTGQAASHAKAVLELLATPLQPPQPAPGFLADLPWLHLLGTPATTSLLDLLVRQPGPHLQAGASQALHQAQTCRQLTPIITFLVSCICKPQALVALCDGGQSSSTNPSWIVFNAHHLLMITLERFVSITSDNSEAVGGQDGNAIYCWLLLLAVIVHRAPAAEVAFMSLGEQERALLVTYAHSLPFCAYFSAHAHHSSLWTMIVGSCVHWYLNTHHTSHVSGDMLATDGPAGEAVLLAWLVLRSCMREHAQFYAPYHAAACMLAPHVKLSSVRQGMQQEANTAVVMDILKQDLRYLMTAVSCHLADGQHLQNWIMIEAQRLATGSSDAIASFLAACMNAVRKSSQLPGQPRQAYTALHTSISGFPEDAAQVCLKLSQQLNSAAFLFVYGDEQGKAALRYLVSFGLGLLTRQTDNILLECIQCVGDMALSHPVLRQDTDVSTVASLVYSYLDDADMAMEEDDAPVTTEDPSNKAPNAAGQPALLWAGALSGRALSLSMDTCKAHEVAAILGWELVLEAAYKQRANDTSPFPWLKWWLTGVAEALEESASLESASINTTQPLNAFGAAALSIWWLPEWGSSVQQETLSIQQRMEGRMTAEGKQALDTITKLAVCVMEHGKNLLQWPITTLSHLCSQIPNLAVQCCLASVRKSEASEPSKPDDTVWEEDVVPETPPEGTSMTTSLRPSGSTESAPVLPVIKCSPAVAAGGAAGSSALVDYVIQTCQLGAIANHAVYGDRAEGQNSTQSVPNDGNDMDSQVASAIAAFGTAFRSAAGDVQSDLANDLEKKIIQLQAHNTSRGHRHQYAMKLQGMLGCVALSVCGSTYGLQTTTPGGSCLRQDGSIPAQLQLALVSCLCCCGSSSLPQPDDAEVKEQDTAPLQFSNRSRLLVPESVLHLEPFLGCVLYCQRCQSAAQKYVCEESQDSELTGMPNDGPCSLTPWLQMQLSCQDAAPVDGYVLQAVASRMCKAAFARLIKGLTDLMSDHSPLHPDQRATAGRLRQQVQQQDVWMLLHASRNARHQGRSLQLKSEEDIRQTCEIIMTALSQAEFAAGALRVLQRNLERVLPCISKVMCSMLGRQPLSRAQSTAFVMICEELHACSSDPVYHRLLQRLVQRWAAALQLQLTRHHAGMYRTSSSSHQQHTLPGVQQVQALMQLGCELSSCPAAAIFAQQQVVEALLSTFDWLHAMIRNNSWQGQDLAEELMLGIGEGAVTMLADLGQHTIEAAKSFATTVLPKLSHLQGHMLIEVALVRLQGLLHKWGPTIMESTTFQQDADVAHKPVAPTIPVDDGFLLLLSRSPAAVALRIGSTSGHLG